MLRIDSSETYCDFEKIGNPAYLTWLVRQGIATTYESMYKHFGLMPYGPGTGTNILDKAIQTLINHNILTLLKGNKLEVTDSFKLIQTGLELSLSDLADSNRNSILCEPIFGRPSPEFRCHIFVIMPFGDPFDEFYEKILKPISSLDGKLKVMRADDPSCLAGESITDNIFQFIFQAKLIIADISNGNPNVFYELGVAHTLGKHVIMLNGNRKFRPFDVEHLRYIPYHLDSQKKLEKMKEKLENDIRRIFGDQVD